MKPEVKRNAVCHWNRKRNARTAAPYSWPLHQTVLVLLFFSLASARAATNEASTDLGQAESKVWEAGVGQGFRSAAESFGVSLGGGYGFAIFGGKQRHDLSWLGLTYGRMLTGTRGEGHWYRGNWELRAELFTGAQFSPETDWLVGVTPHIRYDFATGSRWVPFADLGAGVSATSIGPPDLSGTFEFNLQAATGVSWFLKDDLALSLEGRYLHMSCAGISSPNLGLNTVMGLVSMTWFF